MYFLKPERNFEKLEKDCQKIFSNPASLSIQHSFFFTLNKTLS